MTTIDETQMRWVSANEIYQDCWSDWNRINDTFLFFFRIFDFIVSSSSQLRRDCNQNCTEAHSAWLSSQLNRPTNVGRFGVASQTLFFCHINLIRSFHFSSHISWLALFPYTPTMHVFQQCNKVAMTKIYFDSSERRQLMTDMSGMRKNVLCNFCVWELSGFGGNLFFGAPKIIERKERQISEFREGKCYGNVANSCLNLLHWPSHSETSEIESKGNHTKDNKNSGQNENLSKFICLWDLDFDM